MKLFPALVLAGMLILSFGLRSGFAEDGWKMPNPFARSANPPTSARVTDSSSGWKMPRLWPRTATTQARAAKPSMWQRMSGGTKRMFRSTADAMNPWDDESEEEASSTPSGSGSIFSQRSQETRSAFSNASSSSSAGEKSKSFLPSWSWGSEEPEEPETVNSFLARPRPGY